MDMQAVSKDFSCVIGNIWLARKRKCAAFISSEEYGCPGGVFYCSMMKPNLRFIEHYVTTGFDGTPIHGERYLPSPESMRNFLKQVDPRKAPAKYCIFKPLSLFSGGLDSILASIIIRKLGIDVVAVFFETPCTSRPLRF